MSEVPRFDLADLHAGRRETRDAFDRNLRDALVTFGFVRVRGHGIGHEQIEKVYQAFARFFSSDHSAKLRCASAAGGQRGFTPFGVEHAKDRCDPDLKEFYHVGRELPPGHPLHSQYPANVWPNDLPELRRVSLALYDALDACARTLLESLARAFDLDEDAFSAMLRDGNSILRALHYPPVPADVDGLRAGPHEDINLITLLCEASDAGLEILTRRGEWLAVPAHTGEIVVDAGDMLSRVTNDVIPSTTHRVITPPGTNERHRYSLPFFAHPYPDCDLSAHPAFVESGQAANHPPITAASFLEMRLKEIGLYD